MPIHLVIKDRIKYYQWGKSGKLYKKKSDAEKQAVAIYAKEYKEKSK